MTRPIRLGYSALSNRVYAGRTNDDATMWRGEKHDVTSDLLAAIIQYVEPGNEIEVKENGVVKYKISVREVDS